MLWDLLKIAIRTKRRGLLSKGFAMFHDNIRPHTAAHTVESLRQMNSEVLKHPPYSPDLAPPDVHLFGPLKDALRGHWLASDHGVKAAVHAWLIPHKTLFSEGTPKLVDRKNKCV
jgi:histone-lysine N-methyltransferase SETMAR